MEINVANLLVWVKEPVDEGFRQGLEERVREDPGVVSVGLPHNRPHLMLVAYNPERTQGRAILNRVEDTGVYARVVGL